ncbi:MAG: hypothetical protein HON90_16900 [Halobacteriovoraceae bacterium]|nr:hypothetical protein [Halobacteriovoraceae bacterium]
MIFCFSFLVCETSFSRVPDIASRLYSPLKEVADISFNINAPKVIELLNLKVNQSEKSKISLQAFKFGKIKKINISGLKSNVKGLKKKIEKILLSKINIVWGDDLINWLGTRKFVEEQSGWFTYVDEKALSDTTEIKIKFINQNLQIVEKRPTGTLKANYTFVIKPWSKKRLVLEKVTRETYEGNQSITTDISIEYAMVTKEIWAISNIQLITQQKINVGEDEKVLRNIVENFEFTNFRIDKKSAQSWLEAQNLSKLIE